MINTEVERNAIGEGIYKRIMATLNLARYFINANVSANPTPSPIHCCCYGKTKAFYEGMDMEQAHKNFNISDCSFEDVDVLEETLRDFQVEETI